MREYVRVISLLLVLLMSGVMAEDRRINKDDINNFRYRSTRKQDERSTMMMRDRMLQGFLKEGIVYHHEDPPEINVKSGILNLIFETSGPSTPPSSPASPSPTAASVTAEPQPSLDINPPTDVTPVVTSPPTGSPTGSPITQIPNGGDGSRPTGAPSPATTAGPSPESAPSATPGESPTVAPVAQNNPTEAPTKIGAPSTPPTKVGTPTVTSPPSLLATQAGSPEMTGPTFASPVAPMATAPTSPTAPTFPPAIVAASPLLGPETPNAPSATSDVPTTMRSSPSPALAPSDAPSGNLMAPSLTGSPTRTIIPTSTLSPSTATSSPTTPSSPSTTLRPTTTSRPTTTMAPTASTSSPTVTSRPTRTVAPSIATEAPTMTMRPTRKLLPSQVPGTISPTLTSRPSSSSSEKVTNEAPSGQRGEDGEIEEQQDPVSDCGLGEEGVHGSDIGEAHELAYGYEVVVSSDVSAEKTQGEIIPLIEVAIGNMLLPQYFPEECDPLVVASRLNNNSATHERRLQRPSLELNGLSLLPSDVVLLGVPCIGDVPDSSLCFVVDGGMTLYLMDQAENATLTLDLVHRSIVKSMDSGDYDAMENVVSVRAREIDSLSLSDRTGASNDDDNSLPVYGWIFVSFGLVLFCIMIVCCYLVLRGQGARDRSSWGSFADTQAQSFREDRSLPIFSGSFGEVPEESYSDEDNDEDYDFSFRQKPLSSSAEPRFATSPF